jgi:hypothetical protein
MEAAIANTRDMAGLVRALEHSRPRRSISKRRSPTGYPTRSYVFC